VSESPVTSQALALDARLETIVLKQPFHIAGHVFRDTPVLRTTLKRGDLTGRGEASGVYYRSDTPDKMLATVEGLRAAIEAGISRDELRGLLPAGGARNAIDCALWELEAAASGQPVWRLAKLPPPHPLLTTMTVGADTPQTMAEGARGFAGARAVKMKLTGEADLDAERVIAVRQARPDVWLGVDANQGYTPQSIAPLIATLADCRVQLLEQPFARGREADMDLIQFPMPTAGDESCLDLAELEQVHRYFDVINIKLDKCGGLTEGLMMASWSAAWSARAWRWRRVSCWGSCATWSTSTRRWPSSTTVTPPSTMTMARFSADPKSGAAAD